jgi:Tfp pilus assembly protein PilF
MKPKNKQNENYSGKIAVLISICLALTVLIIYSPLQKFSFVSFDDATYVKDNPHVKAPLSLETLRWAFTSNDSANWHPLTWLSLAIDYQVFKNWAGGFHLVNILFHILNTILLFYLFKYMTNLLWPGFFIAAAFALHPMHVESVAWIAERKDVLSTFFWFLTMIAYVKFVKDRKIKWYLSALTFFIFGLLSKPMLVTLPLVLLLIDYWPLERKFSIGLLVEKIPFFVFSVISSIITFIVQRNYGAMSLSQSFGFLIRIYNAVAAYSIYIWKMIWPVHLAILYPHPGNNISRYQVILSAILLIVIFICIFILRKHKFFTVGALWFIGTLVPVIGIIQVGNQAYADRYTYIPYIGLFIIIAFSARQLISKRIYVSLSLVVLTAWSIASANQVQVWKNDETLSVNALQNTKNNHVVLGNYINYLIDINRIDEAIEQSYKLLQMKPDSYQAHCNLGAILYKQGKMDEAAEQFKLAFKYKPDLAPALFNLALVSMNKGNPQEAVAYCRQAIKIQPDYTAAYLCLGMSLVDLNKIDEAVKVFQDGLKIEPGNSMLKNELDSAMKKYESKK